MIIIVDVFTNVVRSVFDLFTLLYITLKLRAVWAKSVPTQGDPRSKIFQVSERSFAECVVDGAESVPRQRPWNANALLAIKRARHFRYHLHERHFTQQTSGRKAYLDLSSVA